MDNLLFTCNAVLPVILLIVLGYVLKRIHLLPDEFWKMANKLCFRVVLPCLLFYNVYNVSSIRGLLEYWQIVLWAAGSILCIFLLGLIFVILAIRDPKQKGVMLQCVFRSNYAIIGISLVELLANKNEEAVAIAAIISAVSIPLFNILAVISLSIFVHEEGQKVSVKQILLKIAKNPLIIGVLTGIVALAIRECIPTEEVVAYVWTEVDSNTSGAILEKGKYFLMHEVITNTPVFTIKQNIPFMYKTIEMAAKVASPLALIALGGDFTFKAVGALKYKIMTSMLIRLVLVPGIVLTLAYFINRNGFLGENRLIYPAMIALYGTPVAVSSVPMSAEMGNDEILAGQLVVWNTLGSALSLFIIIFICSAIGIFA